MKPPKTWMSDANVESAKCLIQKDLSSDLIINKFEIYWAHTHTHTHTKKHTHTICCWIRCQIAPCFFGCQSNHKNNNNFFVPPPEKIHVFLNVYTNIDTHAHISLPSHQSLIQYKIKGQAYQRSADSLLVSNMTLIASSLYRLASQKILTVV